LLKAWQLRKSIRAVLARRARRADRVVRKHVIRVIGAGGTGDARAAIEPGRSG
jgi:hypothetical protein